MSASHFFVGLGAGVAILAVPVLTLTPAAELPQRFFGWLDAPPTRVSQLTNDNALVDRPEHGYKPGDPTPTPAVEALPTLQGVRPTPTAASQNLQGSNAANMSLENARWAKTGVIRSGGVPVYVRRIAGVDSGQDPLIAEGSPVLVSAGQPVQAGGREWIGIRGLNGVIGWVESSQVAVDGQAATPLIISGFSAPTPVPPMATNRGAPTPQVAASRGTIVNTDGVGVVLRNSPNDADRTPRGLMDGAGVTVLERSGADWLHVRADNGQQGWVPAAYVSTSG